MELILKHYQKKNCNNLSIDVSYICLPKRISKTIEDVLRKYQISLDRILSLDYLNGFLDKKNENLYSTAQKILDGFNENEVYINDKNLKKSGFLRDSLIFSIRLYFLVIFVVFKFQDRKIKRSLCLY